MSNTIAHISVIHTCAVFKWLVCIYQKRNFGFGFWYKFTLCRKRGIETGFWVWLLRWPRCNLLLLLGIKRKWMSSMRKGHCSERLSCQVGKSNLFDFFFGVWLFFWMCDYFLGCFLREKVLSDLFLALVLILFSMDVTVSIFRRICPVAFITLITCCQMWLINYCQKSEHM